MGIPQPEGQRLCGISTASSLIQVEHLHHTRALLYKYRTTRCKNIYQRSTDVWTPIPLGSNVISD